MNIFIFCGPLAFGKGGMEKVAASLAGFLAKKHYVTVGFFSRENQTTPSYHIDSKVILAPWNFKEEGVRNSYIRRIMESRPDVFIYFGASAQIIQIVSLLYNTGIPVIIHEGSNPERVITTNWAEVKKIDRYNASWQRELVYSQAAAIRFTMPEYLESLPSAVFKNKAFAFPNAFETQHEKKKTNNRRIINIGGLKPNKNIKPLLEAFAKLVKDFPEWKLDVFSATNKNQAGDHYVSELEKMVRELSLSKNVSFKGEVDDIDAEFSNSDIHVITSLSEGLSNAVAEAMVNGVPTIGIKNVPGVSGLIENNVNGILVDRENIVDSLTEALFLLISNDSFRNDLSEKAKISSNIFEPKRIYREWEKIINFAVFEKNKHTDEIWSHYSNVLKCYYSNEVSGFNNQINGKAYINALDEIIFDPEFKKIEFEAEKNRWVNV